MDVSPKTLREVEFREKLRGYHPEDVDEFLEQVAAGLEGMQDRLRQAVERAQRAESAAAAAPPPPPPPAPVDTAASDETLRKTLVLAQRTADLAVQEAREQAARILSAAEQQAQSRLAEADERARRTHEDALSDIRAELTSLEVIRQRAQQEVDALNRWVEEHRSQLTASLAEALNLIERVGVRSPAPTSRPIEAPPAPRSLGSTGPPPGSGGPPPMAPPASGGMGLPPQNPPPQNPPPQITPPPAPPLQTSPGMGPPRGGPPPGPAPAHLGPDTGSPRPGAPTFRLSPRPDSGDDSGPPTAAWRPGPSDDRPYTDPRDEVDPTPGQGTPAVARDRGDQDADPEEQALDEFFDEDEEGDNAYLGERRFGGRLRRRH